MSKKKGKKKKRNVSRIELELYGAVLHVRTPEWIQQWIIMAISLVRPEKQKFMFFQYTICYSGWKSARIVTRARIKVPASNLWIRWRGGGEGNRNVSGGTYRSSSVLRLHLHYIYIYITLKSYSGAVPFNMGRVCKTCPFAFFLLFDFFF
jgi:hypothetical protein